MIDPESIDLSSLPWLPIEEKAAFPKRPSIYFAIDSFGNVQYIGRAVNVKHRWVQHHRYDDLKGIGGVKIAYLFVDSPELLPDIEIALIQWFRPPLNFVNNPDKTVKRKGRKVKQVFQPKVGIEDLSCMNFDEWVNNLPQVKRRDEGAKAVQAFFITEEKAMVKEYCDRMGWDASHFMRCLALGYITSEEGRMNGTHA